MPTRRTSARWTGPTRTALAAGAAVVLVLLSGCSSSSDSGGGGSSAEAGSDSLAAPELAEADAGGSAGSAESAADTGAGVQAQQVISTGHVQLRSDDVGQAVFDVRTVVDAYGGQVAEDDTETDRKGATLRSRMVLRVPTADFDAAMDELGAVGTLVSSKRETADVTQEVVDNDVRVEAARRSIDRVQVLFDNATSIKDVVSIEAELSRRQADLASLKAQQRYLADQTAQSTITLAVERTPAEAEEPEPDRDDAGFLAGLDGGWKALQVFLVALATIAGAVLPWLLVGLVLALPGWLVVRRLRRREVTAA